MKPVNVTDANFQAEVLNSDLPVLVDFWAAWCGPCRMMGPVIDEIAGEYEGKLKVCKMNVDENPNTPTKYGIMSIPTLILFKDGAPVKKLIGFRPKNDIIAELGI
ncbi:MULTISPECIES: thioredoxin [Thermovenabulum]|uniref:Thioredoxin n=1 Tax=Thermovenabulum gondwanense TaxID=520767 RepID=A0A161PYN7_9FIRM|nr:Thioredoxin [Thermovenabulum gondwanense]